MARDGDSSCGAGCSGPASRLFQTNSNPAELTDLALQCDKGIEPVASKANEIRAIALASSLGSTAPIFTDDQVVLLLRAAIEREGGQAAFAKRYGFDGVYLTMVLNGGRRVGSTVAKALGLRKAYIAESMSTDLTAS